MSAAVVQICYIKCISKYLSQYLLFFCRSFSTAYHMFNGVHVVKSHIDRVRYD